MHPHAYACPACGRVPPAPEAICATCKHDKREADPTPEQILGPSGFCWIKAFESKFVVAPAEACTELDALTYHNPRIET
jgi:hypothetical protein